MRTNLAIINQRAVVTGSIARNVAGQPKFCIIAAPPTRPTSAPPEKVTNRKLFLWKDLPNDTKGNRKHRHPNSLCRSSGDHKFHIGGKSSCDNTYGVDCHYNEQYLFLAVNVRELSLRIIQ